MQANRKSDILLLMKGLYIMNEKIALVTGGTSGIGKCIVSKLLKKGCKVITCYSKNSLFAESLKEEYKDADLSIVKCDVSDELAVKKMFEFIEEKYGKLDYLVNNAGTFIDNKIKDFDSTDFRKVLDVNLIGKFNCTKYAYEIMEEGGSIVNISSPLGMKPCTESPAYCAASAAIINFTKATALEYADKKIRANSICPSLTITPLSTEGWTEAEIEEKKKETPLGRLATPEDTANLCIFLLSEESSFITGENVWLNGGRF